MSSTKGPLPAGADVVIVGSGSAGCTVARRLTDAGVEVLLIEAGPPDDHPAIADPVRTFELWGSDLDYRYVSTFQPACNGRRIEHARGRVIGGSSSINGMYYARGHRSDYDTWAYLGNTGWGYDEVLPLFERSEDFDAGPSEARGVGGLMPVMSTFEIHPVVAAMMEAAEQAGVPRNPDYNAGVLDGFAPIQFNIRNGVRASSARAFLGPVLDRPNLTVRSGCSARRLRFKGTRCVGVDVLHEGAVQTVAIGSELILSAGTFDSPKLLMLSGVGPASELRRHGLDVVVDLPGVGQNLQDHVFSPLVHASLQPIPSAVTGISQFHAHMFFRSRQGLVAPDLQALMGHMPHYPDGWTGPDEGFTFTSMLNRPASRGTVTLASADAEMPPLIDPRYATCAVDVDAMVAGLRRLREVAAQSSLAPWRGEELCPGPGITSDSDLRAYVRATLSTIFHPVGTCKMGGDELAVVDRELRLHGAESIRVVDASVMPTITSANTHAPTVMIAERASDLILAG